MSEKNNLERIKELCAYLENTTDDQANAPVIEELAGLLEQDVAEFKTDDILLKVYDNLINTFYKTEDYDKALAYALKGLERSGQIRYLHMAGNCKINTRNYPEAEDFFTRAIEASPEYASAYMNRGYAKFCQRKPEEAITDYETALAQDVNDNHVFYHLGVAHHSLENYAAAHENYGKFIYGAKDTTTEPFTMLKEWIQMMPTEYQERLSRQIKNKVNAQRNEPRMTANNQISAKTNSFVNDTRVNYNKIKAVGLERYLQAEEGTR